VFNPGETWIFECTKFVDSCTTAPFNLITNFATSSTTVADPFGDKTVEDEASNNVTVACLDPSTELTKTSDRTFVNPGETITYTYLEENNGNVSLNPPTLADDTCSPVTPVLSVGFNVGDANQDNVFDPGETWQFTCTYIPADCTEDPIVNTATSSTTVVGFPTKPVPDEEASTSVDCEVIIDSDGDGIEDSIDTEPQTPSAIFDDGFSSGQVTSGQEFLTITDVDGPGISIAATGPATVSACGISSISFVAGEVTVICSSVTIEVISGTVEVEFTADDGTTATTTLDTGDNVTFDSQTVTITNNGVNAVDVIVNGETTNIGGGESKTIIVDSDDDDDDEDDDDDDEDDDDDDEDDDD